MTSLSVFSGSSSGSLKPKSANTNSMLPAARKREGLVFANRSIVGRRDIQCDGVRGAVGVAAAIGSAIVLDFEVEGGKSRPCFVRWRNILATHRLAVYQQGFHRHADRFAEVGTGFATFDFKVKDDGGTNSGSDTDSTANTITLDVTPSNDAPVGENKTFTLTSSSKH